ncbi:MULTISPECIES: ABC transporter ATP-binding protein [Metallosphaera]|uniref:Trehalose ABC transporter ATP-binding protein n=3 Tax=Metallosphaera TaxID=41980 RepID=A4YG93_METS5|nr:MULTISPECIES: ABC transporter ATP-binding protein [Metallosphaera]ABP95445.1 trehalose ABC transporter ATP-binding protein [Metallosphaera sedula DSM 5348]AIM27430.1 trehalose ABC transporter ATP-binding protein [Metallosphaera sedula]AKV74303.1 ABC transporter [Metallosphaera sedula]AKV76542.1 ABC transporter [Metallosphaera sedula]AKV78794.1 ABC transporter [Metallosphaera sedula]
MTVELVELVKVYGTKRVLDGVTEKIESGEFFVILGPSGEGKSTLLRIMAGIEKPDKGKILVDGVDVTNKPPEKRNVAMVFQNYALYPNMTVRDNIAFPLKMKGMKKEEIQESVEKVAGLLGISEILDKKVTKISGGQQQRVAIARAIVRNPSYYLLDEPLSNLDARMRTVARGELKRIQKELKGTFIYVTHDQKEALSLADRVAVLHAGKFEQVSKPKDLYDYPRTKWVAEFIGDFPMNFVPGEILGEKAEEVGFRPEWVNVGKGELTCSVESVEAVGDSRYLICVFKGYGITILSEEYYDVGDEVKFEITQYRQFKDGQLVEE